MTGSGVVCTIIPPYANCTISGGGAGSSNFQDITTGTNTTATMTVGTGAQLVPSGTGVVRASDVVCTSCIALGTEVSGSLPLANLPDATPADLCLKSGGAGDPAFEPCQPEIVVTDAAYGAVGNGSTDNCTAWGLVDAATPATGARVIIPAGTYLSSCPLKLRQQSTYQGDGAGATVLQTPTTGTGLALMQVALPRTCTGGVGDATTCDDTIGGGTRGPGCVCYVNADCNSLVCAGGTVQRNVVVSNLRVLTRVAGSIGIDFALISEGTIREILSGATVAGSLGVTFSDGGSMVGGYSNNLVNSKLTSSDICVRIMDRANDTRVYGSTISSSCGIGLQIDSPSSGVKVWGNLFQSNTTKDASDNGQNTWWGPNRWEDANPKLVIESGATNTEIASGNVFSGAGTDITNGGTGTTIDGIAAGTPDCSLGGGTRCKAGVTANTVYAGPASGGAAAPTFRALVDDDIPNTLTASNYVLKAGDVMTGLLHIDNNQGLRLSEADGSGANYVEQQVAPRADDIVLRWNVAPGTCTGDANGGALTLTGTGPYDIVCSTDDGGAGGGMTSFFVEDDSAGSPQTITNAETLTIAGGAGTVTTVGATDTLTIATASTEPNFASSASLTCGVGTSGKFSVGDGSTESPQVCANDTKFYLALGDASGNAVNVADFNYGDISVSGGIWAVNTDSVALGTDTTGSYAAGDAEAGNATGLACTTCVDLATEVGTFTSANLSGRLTDETGTGAAVFAQSPSFVSTVGVTNTASASVVQSGGIAQSQVALFVAQTNAQDALIRWSRATGPLSWAAGLDTSDSNKWKLSASLDLGTNDAISVDPSTLAVTIPNGVVGNLTGNADTATTAGAVPFSGVSSGTNTTGAMVIDTGSSLSTSGSGIILATSATSATTAGSANALSANGSNCPAGQAAGGVSTVGAAEDCIEPALLAGRASGQTIKGTSNASGADTLVLTGGGDTSTGLHAGSGVQLGPTSTPDVLYLTTGNMNVVGNYYPLMATKATGQTWSLTGGTCIAATYCNGQLGNACTTDADCLPAVGYFSQFWHTIDFQADSNAVESFIAGQFVPIITGSGAATRNLGPMGLWRYNPEIRLPAATTNLTVGGHYGQYFAPTYTRPSGTQTGTGASVVGTLLAGNVSAGWTITDWIGHQVSNPTNAGTITNLGGLDVAALSVGAAGGQTFAVRSAIDAATQNHFLLSTGTAQSKIAGNVGIGSGTVAPAAKLDVRQASGTTPAVKAGYNDANFGATTTETRDVFRFNDTYTSQPNTNGTTHTYNVLDIDPTITAQGVQAGDGSTIRGLNFEPTMSIGQNVTIRGVRGAGTYTNNQNPFFGTWTLFEAAPLIRSQTANVAPYTPLIFYSAVVAQYDVASGTATLPNFRDYYAGGIAQNLTAGGTFNVTSWDQFTAQGRATETAGTLNIGTRRGVFVDNLAITGTPQVVTQIGLDVAAQTRATGATACVSSGVPAACCTGAGTGTCPSNIGIRNADTTVLTPSTVQTITAGGSILCNASVVQVQVGSDPITTSTTTAVADGTDGQMCTIVMVDSTANDTLIVDGSGANLRLAGAVDYSMEQGDTLVIMWNATLGDWVEVSRSNN